MEFQYQNQVHRVEVFRKNNKNTYVRVKDGNIVVTTNFFTTERSIKRLLEKNRKTIEKMLEREERKLEKQVSFQLFGKPYEIIYGNFQQDVKIEQGRIEATSEDALMKYLKQLMETIFLEHLTYWYHQFEEKIPVPNLKIRKMKTRWGVCNVRNHNVTLNLELYRYEMECLDYVIVHELSHFLVQNHSKEFWNVVAKYCPNYKEIRKKLRSW